VLPRTDLRGMSLELILNPSRYTLIAVGRTIVPPNVKLTPPPKKLPPGTTVTWVESMQLAIIRQSYVSRPGVRP
jgi:hypothetical protein